MSTLLKMATVAGISMNLEDRGLVQWPNEETAKGVFSKIAAAMEGPDMLPEGGLAKESALEIGKLLKEASDALYAQGHRPDATMRSRQKQASEVDFESRAADLAVLCMDKAAAEASLVDTGSNTPEEAARTDMVARLDQQNRATAKYNVGVGRTMMPNGGVVGRQMVHPEKQSGPDLSNSLTALDKQASDGLMGRVSNSGVMNALRSGLGYTQGGGVSNKLQALKAVAEQSGMDPEALAAAVKKLKANNANPQMRAMLGSTAIGAGLGAGAGALSDDEHRGRNALIGGALGGAGGALGGAGLHHMLANPQSRGMQLPGRNLGLPEHASKMAGLALEFLIALNEKVANYSVDPRAIVAAAGLAEKGAEGREAMEYVLHSVKTASEADEAIAMILQHQGDLGELASPELVAALQEYLASDEGGEGGEGGDMPPEAGGMPEGGAEMAGGVKAASRMGALASRMVSSGRAAANTAGEVAKAFPKATNALKGVAAVGALGGAAATGAAAQRYSDRRKAEPKTASDLLEMLKASAEGSLVPSTPNTPEAAAQSDLVADLDQKNRSTDEYNEGQGKTQFPNKGQVGAVQAAPKHERVSTDTVPSRETKTADDLAYEASFKKIASDYAPVLAGLTQSQKIAHIQALMSLPPSQRAAYVQRNSR